MPEVFVFSQAEGYVLAYSIRKEENLCIESNKIGNENYKFV